jgi:hypothetical protein
LKRTAKAQGTPALPGFEPVVYTPTITTRQPDGSLVIKAGKPVMLGGEDEIGTTEAGRLMGCTGAWVEKLCDRGTLQEGVDWRRIGARGNYKIKRASIIALAYPNQP